MLHCFEAARIQIKRNPQQAIDHYPEKGVFQHISWAVNLDHEGRRTFVLKCQETKITGDVTERNTFAWVTDVRPNKHNAAKLVREARRRWVVEEAFNIQKNGGYELTNPNLNKIQTLSEQPCIINDLQKKRFGYFFTFSFYVHHKNQPDHPFQLSIF